MSTQQRAIFKTYAAVAVISAIIGFGAIYAMRGPGDNAGSENTAAAGDVKPSGGSGKPAAVRRLNTGAMATFVFKDTPMELPPIAFNGPDGKPRTLADWKGKVVLLNIWATWCAPCLKEMPHLDKLQAELSGDKFDVLTVSIDRGSPAKPKAFLENIKAKALKLYHDPSAQLGFTLKAIGTPTTLLVDGQGREIGRLVGPAEWDSKDARRLIRAYLDR